MFGNRISEKHLFTVGLIVAERPVMLSRMGSSSRTFGQRQTPIVKSKVSRSILRSLGAMESEAYFQIKACTRCNPNHVHRRCWSNCNDLGADFSA